MGPRAPSGQVQKISPQLGFALRTIHPVAQSLRYGHAATDTHPPTLIRPNAAPSCSKQSGAENSSWSLFAYVRDFLHPDESSCINKENIWLVVPTDACKIIFPG